MEPIQHAKFEIQGLKDREVSLYKNGNLYAIKETESPLTVITLGESFGIDKFNEIVEGYRKGLISMNRNFKLTKK